MLCAVLCAVLCVMLCVVVVWRGKQHATLTRITGHILSVAVHAYQGEGVSVMPIIHTYGHA